MSEENDYSGKQQHDQLPAADEVLVDNPRIRKPWRKTSIITSIIVTIAVVFALGLAIGLRESPNKGDSLGNSKKESESPDIGDSLGDSKKESESPDKGDSLGDTIKESQGSPDGSDKNGDYITADKLIAKGIALNGGVEFENPTSYQSKALKKLRKFPIITSSYYTDQKIAQRYALLCFYYRTYHVRTDTVDTAYGYGTTPLWMAISPWRNAWADDECNWYGIACNMAGLVTRIELTDHHLTGYVPMELKLLDGGPLAVIDLSGNPGLGQGGFPAVFSEINKLDALALSGCSFTGSVPQEVCDKSIDFFTVNCDCDCSCCQSCEQDT